MPAKPLTGAGVTGGHYHHSQLAAAHFYHCKGHDCFCKDRASALQRQIFSSAKTDPQLSAQTDLQLCKDRPSALHRQTFSAAKTDCKDRPSALQRQTLSSAKTRSSALQRQTFNSAETDLQLCRDRPSAPQRQTFSSAKTDPKLCRDRPSALQRQTEKTDLQLCKDRPCSDNFTVAYVCKHGRVLSGYKPASRSLHSGLCEACSKACSVLHVKRQS